jgi:hypothetical protein
MTELQGGRNVAVDYQDLGRKVEGEITAAQQKQNAETPTSETPAPSSKFAAAPAASSSAPSDDARIFTEAVVHTALLSATGPVGAAVGLGVSLFVGALGSKKQQNNPMFSEGSKATHKDTIQKKTITPGLHTGGKRNFAGAKVEKTASPALKAKQAKGEMAGSIFMTRQSVQSLNDNKITKGLNTAAAKPAALVTAIHLANLGHIRRSQAQGPKIVADSKILSKDAVHALKNGDDQTWNGVTKHASDATYLTQHAAPTPPSSGKSK